MYGEIVNIGRFHLWHPYPLLKNYYILQSCIKYTDYNLNQIVKENLTDGKGENAPYKFVIQYIKAASRKFDGLEHSKCMSNILNRYP